MNITRAMDEVDEVYTRNGQKPLFDSVTRRFVLEAADRLSDSFLVSMFRNAKESAIRMFGEAYELEEAS